MACNGRSDEELKDALGLFAQHLPVRCQMTPDRRFGEVLLQVDEVAKEVCEWQESFSWDLLVRTNGKDDDLSFFPICYEYEAQAVPYVGGDVSFTVLGRHSYFDRFKVKLSCFGRDDVLIAELHYDSGLFTRAEIERFGGQFERLMESVIARPEAGISELEILSEEERQQLLVRWNDTHAEYPQNRCFHPLFERQVEDTPDAAAVVFESQQLTYLELNRRSNQLARHLQKLGAGPEVVVGLCVNRSVEMVVGLLGILKAGGAYLPLDPAYPPERLAFMLKDVQALALLT